MILFVLSSSCKDIIIENKKENRSAKLFIFELVFHDLYEFFCVILFNDVVLVTGAYNYQNEICVNFLGVINGGQKPNI